MFKENDNNSGGCSGVAPRARRLLPRFSLRRLLYSSPFIARRIVRTPSSTNRNTKAKEPASAKNTDVEKGEARVSNGSSQFQVQNTDLQRASSKGSVLSSAGKSNENGWLECPLCLAELPVDFFPVVQSCHHRSCYDCFQQYLKVEISESRVNIACPECSEPLHPNDIRMILNDQTQFEKYEDFMVRRVLAVEPDARWCPAPDCSFAVIASGCASCPKLRCGRPGCDSYFCYHCKARWHPNQTCDAARAQRTQYYERSSSLNFSQSDSQHRDDIKPCPSCQVFIMKMDDGSCNHMICSVCGAEFCWLCMKEISDLHYLSPSGCTFWGKKPWSRKKKILWQLGTLVGAPVGIGLAAGIAVPAMIIGIPVWVGKELYTRYEKANKHKRNAFIVGGVTASVLVSPVLAGLAVGIGVPILLFYVYGVVPVSLCRNGGCGVSTNGTGVRFDFDDENELMGSLGVRNGGDAASIDVASHRGGNPSIGEASLSLGSGSQLEKLGRENDRESASNVAIAGTSLAGNSLAGSIASSVLPGGQRLEVQADVTSTQRFSLCSETASAITSLSEKSVNASVPLDDVTFKVKRLTTMLQHLEMDDASIRHRKATEGEQGTGSDAGEPMDSAGQATSLSSLKEAFNSCFIKNEEVEPGLAKRARRKVTLDRQGSDWSNWTVCLEDGEFERLKFDDPDSYIDIRRAIRRKRMKEAEQETAAQKTVKNSNGESKTDSLADDTTSRERVNVATLRNVFFHSSTVSSDREKRLSVIEEPAPVGAQNNDAPPLPSSEDGGGTNNTEKDSQS
ncbi:E3 ubiquitin-protein ligase RNF19A [Calliopsis andreniformis]|uniref:E3 ubiquitin-protein ligase RNF19A n=1 Tax=Calliopsis andreniformis TaxID=337506 RepID=UPI003FCCC52B